jgi:glycosyltransferase involved in cell wall biosynthesis
MRTFIGGTIESVLSQDYPHVEYLIRDAGSTDGTLDIVRKLQREGGGMRMRVVSEPDDGAADAVNKGFKNSSGEIFGYLHGDDTYAPGAIAAVVDHFLADKSVDAVYGDAEWVGADGESLGMYPTKPFDAGLLSYECFICQPASFLRREAFERVGMLDPSLRCSFDYEFWMRFAREHRAAKIDRLLAHSRMRRDSKSLGHRRETLRETIEILRRHFGYAPFPHVHSYVSYQLDQRDQFFEPLRPSLTKYMLSLPVGCWLNARHPVRYVCEWMLVMNKQALLRYLRRFKPEHHP